MDRKAEFARLSEELNIMPKELDDVVARQRIRAQKDKRRVHFGVPTLGLAAAVALFLVMVNTSTAFAYAMGRVPVLGDIARAVAFSPSLKAAVDNRFVQPMGLQKSDGQISARIEYIIVDKKQVNVFYTLSQEGLWCDAILLDEELSGYVLSSGKIEQGEIGMLSIDFAKNDVPSSLRLALVAMQGEEKLASLEFALAFDAQFTQAGRTIAIGQWVQLGEQRLFISDCEIYPTHLRLNVADDPDNSAWLKQLDFTIIGEDGTGLDRIKNGITATGVEDSPFMASHRLESNYFSKDRAFTLRIQGARWLSKAHERIQVDLETLAADFLPQGVRLSAARRTDSGWVLEAIAPYAGGETMYSPFAHEFYDEEGKVYHTDSVMTTQIEGGAEHFRVQIPLKGFTQTRVILGINYSHEEKLLQPIDIVLD